MSDGGISLPGMPSEVPGIPSNFRPLPFEVFETLNTKSPRPAIGDAEMAICDGWMPVGPNNLRTLPGTGSVSFTSTVSISWIGFGNIAANPWGLALRSNGSLLAFNTNNSTISTIMAAGTITSVSSILGFSQWGSDYLVFAKDQTNGYWLWDGSLLYTAGTMSPVVTMDNPGSAYTSSPTISLITTGSGVSVTFSPTVENGRISKVAITNQGSGFAIGDFVGLRFTGGGSDNQASATTTVDTSAGGVDAVYVINGGAQYTYRTKVDITGGGGGTGAVISVNITNGVITGGAVVNPGSGYTSTPVLAVNDPGIPGSVAIPGGLGASLGCSISSGQVTALTLVSGGSGYIAAPAVKIIGDGVGAQALAQISGGSIAFLVMTNFGKDYTKALVVFQGGNNAANATPLLMPFGISGTSVEVYQQRVWVANGAAVASVPPRTRVIYSAPNSPVDFSNGGGAFASTDSFLKVGYYWLKQTNGFLYLGGDSSLNQIAGVQTSVTGGSAVTTFGNQNVDPQLGSSWPSSVQVFSRNIVFGNSIGVFASYGGAVTKISDALDGFYGSGSITSPTANFSAAVATIYRVPVYMLLLPVVDQFTGSPVNKLLMWDGKRWFTSQQDRTLTYIATQEINSQLIAWGTDGTNVFQIFAQPSAGFTKTVQSKLFAAPAYYTTKTAIRLHGITSTALSSQTLTITLDNESGAGTGNALKTVVPSLGFNVFGPLPVGQAGRLIGFTVQTTAGDISLLSLNAAEQTYSTNL